MAEADATVARGTVEHRIKESELDLELKRLETRAGTGGVDRIANARVIGELGAERRRRAIAEAAIGRG
jgi:hypothetical protein